MIQLPENHLIGELYNVSRSEILDSPALMEKLLRDLSNMIGEEVLAIHVHEFEPYGVSAFLLLKEGYVALHTWPEHTYAAANVVSYSDEKWCWDTFNKLVSLLSPSSQTAIIVKTGI
ncbi:MAG: hypothetical protein C0200_07910 [Thermoproteota archaeon]|nr:MAG: hypothetical protein C0200_07910 [Candidatus Korarchaeota archaeon]